MVSQLKLYQLQTSITRALELMVLINARYDIKEVYYSIAIAFGYEGV